MIRIRKSFLVKAGTACLIIGLILAACSLGEQIQRPGQPDQSRTPVPTPDPNRPRAPSVQGADHIAVFDVMVNWQDLSDNEDGFKIYRRRTDILSDDAPVLAGTAGENATQFHDTDTFCGATYQYIIASYNEVGESPATACWQITLPPCQSEQDILLTAGVDNAYNFLARAPGQPGDFYMNIGGDGRVVFLADQSGQFGLFDFGSTDDTPLERITIPDSASYEQGGVPVMAEHRYVAEATDGSSLVLFDVNGLGAAADITYTVWPDTGPVDSAACTYAGLPGFGDLGLPAGIPTSDYCVSGDGVCDPTCLAPPEDATDVPVAERPVLVEVSRPDSPPSPDELAMRAAYDACVAEVTGAYGSADTWDVATREAAIRAFRDCMDARGVHMREGPVEEVVEVRRTTDEVPGDIPITPTYTDTDLDCTSQACVPNDNICVPGCGGIALYPASEGWNPPVCVDTNGNGYYDLCATINDNPASPYYGQNRNWNVEDGDCGGGNVPDQPGNPPPPPSGECVPLEGDGICCTLAGETFLTDPNSCPGPSCGSPCASDAECAGLGVNPACVGGFCYDAQTCEPDRPPPGGGNSGGDQPGGGQTSVCGNGIVESGEACEGSKGSCDWQTQYCTSACTCDTLD